MFICQKCKTEMELPICKNCNHTVSKINYIWQISNMPDIVVDGNGDNYIGYEHIGEAYSGNRKFIIEDSYRLFAEVIACKTNNGIFLDLACGDGCLTVPCASYGTRIIAGDISNTMLTILQEKALHNNISLENVTLCRINALDIPLVNESINTVVANSVLHLISNPEKVIKEIYRVLKIGGLFICKDDTPGRDIIVPFDNSKYIEIVNNFYNEYWRNLKNYEILPKKYSWKFDRNYICNKLFSKSENILIERGNTYEISLKDGFLPRFVRRGFSDQVDVPKYIHDNVIEKLINQFKERYGDDFLNISFKGIEENILITIYTK